MFQEGFLWGASTAAYQIEGDRAGRGDTVWDEFCRRPGRVYDGHNGDVACDHVARLEEDLDLMSSMGLKAYRFSIAWARVLPEGVGTAQESGLAFYDRLIDGLLSRGIEPVVTLYHWDMPLALFRRGGWLNRSSADWFAEYTRVVVDRLGDRVGHWLTLNEPQVFLNLGHHTGTHAPGLELSLQEVVLAAHHALLAHGRAVGVLRERAKRPPTIGFAPLMQLKSPADESEASVAAARAASMRCMPTDLWNNTWFSDPVFFGRYPEDGLRLYGDGLPRGYEADLATISEPLDLLGLNVYWGGLVKAGPDGLAVEVPRGRGHPQTAFRWAVDPGALYWGPRFMHERYGKPVLITENGLSNIDFPDADGRVDDPQRVAFTASYLRALGRAAAEGVPVAGYLHWSLLDNFEWAEGYKERFGLVYVDYETLQRTPKTSAHWYRDVIASNGGMLAR
ncbi:MAG: GH1 family beta-glucosidase [Phycisphaerales bacterium]